MFSREEEYVIVDYSVGYKKGDDYYELDTNLSKKEAMQFAKIAKFLFRLRYGKNRLNAAGFAIFVSEVSTKAVDTTYEIICEDF